MRIFPRGSAYTQLTEYSQEDDEEDEGSEVVKLRSLVKRHEKECGNLKNSNADLIKRLSVLDKAEENVESAKSSAEDALEQAQEAVKKRDTARNMGDDPGDVTIGNLSGCRSQQEQDYGNKLERLQQLENERNSAIAEADHARKSLITLQKTVQELEQNIHDEAGEGGEMSSIFIFIVSFHPYIHSHNTSPPPYRVPYNIIHRCDPSLCKHQAVLHCAIPDGMGF